MSAIDVEKHMRENAALDAGRYVKDTYSQHALEEFCKEFDLDKNDPNLQLIYKNAFLNGAVSAMREVLVNGSFNSAGGGIPND